MRDFRFCPGSTVFFFFGLLISLPPPLFLCSLFFTLPLCRHFYFDYPPLFFFFGGNFGAILAVALKDIPVYILVNIGLKKENLSMIRQDAWATVLLLSLIALGIGVRLLLDLGIPGLREANLLTLGINFLNMVKP